MAYRNIPKHFGEVIKGLQVEYEVEGWSTLCIGSLWKHLGYDFDV